VHPALAFFRAGITGLVILLSMKLREFEHTQKMERGGLKTETPLSEQ